MKEVAETGRESKQTDKQSKRKRKADAKFFLSANN